MMMKTKSTAFTLGFLSFVSMFTIMIGMGLCLTKSPQQKSDEYVRAAQSFLIQYSDAYLTLDTQAYLQETALDLTQKAIKTYPYSAAAWQIFSDLSSNPQAIYQAEMMASKLGASDENNNVAMELLPAKNIALIGYDNNNLIQ